MMLPLVFSMTSTIYTILLLILTICSLLETIRAEEPFNPPYRIKSHSNGAIDQDNEVKLKPIDEDNGFELPVNKLQIFWLNSSTHSISVRWALEKSYNMTGFIKDSVVEYFPKGGRFTSHPLEHDVREYTYENLEAGTMYTVCVYMTEVYGESNESSIVHSKCVKINTIDYIRRDSVVIMIITLGYYAFMGLIGYTQWKRRLWRVRNNNKKRYNYDDVVSNSDNENVCVMRWRELAEREKLMSKPGCSIECNDT